MVASMMAGCRDLLLGILVIVNVFFNNGYYFIIISWAVLIG